MQEAKYYDVFEGITQYEKKLKTLRVIGIIVFIGLTITAVLELIFAALVQHGATVLSDVNPLYQNILYALSWINGTAWALCFSTYLVLSCLIFYRSLRVHAESVTSQKSVIMVINSHLDLTVISSLY
jgi:uncharacterized protein involved in cysteine biosynthesis